MTAYVTRSPLQLIHNLHIMSEPRRSSRRLSARLGDKEDAPLVNGLAHGQEKARGGQTPGNSTRQPKASVNGATSGPKGKRKLGTWSLILERKRRAAIMLEKDLGFLNLVLICTLTDFQQITTKTSTVSNSQGHARRRQKPNQHRRFSLLRRIIMRKLLKLPR